MEDEILEQDFLKTIVLETLSPEDTLLTCESGVQAIKLAKQHQPNIIIMDVMIPEMDGLSALHEIRKFLPSVCITILSAYADFPNAQKAIKLRVFEYQLKPIKPKVFKEIFLKMLTSVAEYPVLLEETTETTIIEHKEYQHNFIEESVKYIKEQFKERLTLEMVASKVFMNPKYFSHVFKKDIGISFTEYVIDLKIQYACRLLGTTNYPAYRISIECGFSDPSYFNRVFSAKMNMTPNIYRKCRYASKTKE
ncbi:response regulator transcription factor [Clostridium sp.]|uniref:response regulator transcription factor n=1 Tax=Clostridium sp. TaxID=1506 RepID=UPI003D6CDAC0